MTPPITAIDLKSTQPHPAGIRNWWHPTIFPEHGVYVMLLVSFLTGSAVAQHWTQATTFKQVRSPLI